MAIADNVKTFIILAPLEALLRTSSLVDRVICILYIYVLVFDAVYSILDAVALAISTIGVILIC